MTTVYILIKGKVQGVFYRATAKEIAEQLNLTGWVKNTKEGAVEAIATGDANSIKTFIDWCKRGPRKAEVTAVEIKELDEQLYTNFSILRD